MNIKVLSLTLFTLIVLGCNQEKIEVTQTLSGVSLNPGEVLALAKETKEASYDMALNKGAEIIPIDENKGFLVWYAPSDFDPKTDTVLVSLHGHGAWATREFMTWLPTITKRHYAFLGVQWWFGETNESDGYYDPDAIYGFIKDELALKEVTPGNAIFHGFSRGATNTFSVAASDKWEGPGYFGVNIVDSGAYHSNFPPNAKISTYGDSAFKDSHWILYCGEKDTDQPTTCADMRTTNTWLTSLGGIVDLFLDDADGSHGSMMLNTDNLAQVMDLADEIIKSGQD